MALSLRVLLSLSLRWSLYNKGNYEEAEIIASNGSSRLSVLLYMSQFALNPDFSQKAT